MLCPDRILVIFRQVVNVTGTSKLAQVYFNIQKITLANILCTYLSPFYSEWFTYNFLTIKL